MTIILMAKFGDDVWCGCDGQITAGETTEVVNVYENKIITAKSCIISKVGSDTDTGNLEEYIYRYPRALLDHDMSNGLVDIRRFLRGYLRWMKSQKKKMHQDPHEFFVGYPNKMFRVIYSVDTKKHISVKERNKFIASGSGRLCAKPLMDFLMKESGMKEPEAILRKVLEYVCRYDSACGGELNIFKVSERLKG